jgi:chromosome segregation ATPase
MLDQLRSSHENELVELKALHASSLDEHTTPLRKNIRQLTLELTATQEDLNKSKAALAASHTEIASLRKQLVEAREAIELALANTNSASEAQLTKARHDLSSANETLETYKRILAESQETLAADMEAIKSAHKREVDELIGTHSEAVNAMKHAHKDALAKVAAERESLQSRFEDERDAKEKALAQVAASARTPASPRPSANTTGVSKEELEKMHQAHNAMTIELEAEHAKAVQVLKDELEAKQHALETAEADASRKELEINFMMSEKEELDGELQR